MTSSAGGAVQARRVASNAPLGTDGGEGTPREAWPVAGDGVAWQVPLPGKLEQMQGKLPSL